MLKPYQIAVLISGGGTTLRNLIQRWDENQLNAQISLVLSNNPQAGGLDFARQANLQFAVVDHRSFDTIDAFSDAIFHQVQLAQADLVVMGGFLRRLKIPQEFENKVINIHPSLIPSFCGKGHYGQRVHQAVLDYGCKVSGCTVHFVDDQYDHGPIIAQRTVEVQVDDGPQELAERVFAAECDLYPQVINALAANQIQVDGRKVVWTSQDA